MNIEKLLTDIYETMEDRSVRGNIGIFHTVSAFHNSDLTQAFLEGYENTKKINQDLPEIPVEVFQKAASAAITELYKRGRAGAASFWVDNNYASSPPNSVYIGMKTLSTKPFTLAKSIALNIVNQHLKSAGKSQIIAAKAVDAGEEGIADTAFRHSSHIAHSKESSVGLARTMLSIKALELADPFFKEFINSEEATQLRNIFDSLQMSYSIKAGPKNKMILQQVEPINVTLQAASLNLAKTDTDASKLKSLFAESVAAYVEKNLIVPQDLVESDVENPLLEIFKKNIYAAAVTIAKSFNKVSASKYAKTKTVRGSKGNKSRPSGRRAKLSQNKKRRTNKTGRRNTAMLLQYIKSNLLSTLEERMGPKGPPSTLSEVLSNQTGRFSSGVRVSSVTPTKQNFLRIEYSYEKPYDTFEVGSRQGSPARDPRKLIKLTIDDLVEAFSKKQGWGSSPYGRIYPVKLNMRKERGR